MLIVLPEINHNGIDIARLSSIPEHATSHIVSKAFPDLPTR